jgi:hypothetical protein
MRSDVGASLRLTKAWSTGTVGLPWLLGPPEHPTCQDVGCQEPGHDRDTIPPVPLRMRFHGEGQGGADGLGRVPARGHFYHHLAYNLSQVAARAVALSERMLDVALEAPARGDG